MINTSMDMRMTGKVKMLTDGGRKIVCSAMVAAIKVFGKHECQ